MITLYTNTYYTYSSLTPMKKILSIFLKFLIDEDKWYKLNFMINQSNSLTINQIINTLYMLSPKIIVIP